MAGVQPRKAGGIQSADVGQDCTRAGTPFARGFRGAKAPDGIQSAQGWSGVQGARRLPVDGMGPGQGQRESSLPGLHEMVRGLGGRNAPSRWVQGERSLPASGQPEIRLNGSGTGAIQRAKAGGMQRGCAAAPLPRWCCTTTHILRARGRNGPVGQQTVKTRNFNLGRFDDDEIGESLSETGRPLMSADEIRLMGADADFTSCRLIS